MKEFTFEPNQLVSIRVVSAEDKDELYTSRIEDLGQETISLAAPIYKGAVKGLPPGREIWVEFAAGGCFYRFQTVVLENIAQPLPLLVVLKPSQIQRCNRRRFFRFQARLLVSCKQGEDTYTGRTVDLSGNGLCALFPGKLDWEDGQVTEFLLSLPDGVLSAQGRIVRLEIQENNSTCLYAEFVDLAEQDQDRIVSFLFAQQRKSRQRGLV